jgi:hypothetical protein
MEKYAGLHPNHGVDTYLITPTSIKVKFITGPTVYVYSYDVPGKSHVEEMKKLAIAGRGLSTYISREIKKNFDHKE